MESDVVDQMQAVFRESRLARAGAWCSLVCIPGAGYLAGAALFGYPVAATPLSCMEFSFHSVWARYWPAA